MFTIDLNRYCNRPINYLGNSPVLMKGSVPLREYRKEVVPTGTLIKVSSWDTEVECLGRVGF